MAVISFDRMIGFNDRDPATRIPDGFGTSALNILYEYGSLGYRRPSSVAVSLTSGPTTGIVYGLIRHQPATVSSDAELWAFSGTSTVHRRVSGTWSSVTASDTVAGWSGGIRGATLNGKLFLAYNSDVNRLHVWDGTSVRRVGLEQSSAPTAADTAGAGTYAGTRYFKVRFKIISGSNTIAMSELSAAVTFNPSGANVGATVTKPTTVDSATHWQVYASSDNLNFYELSGDIVVGTTTYATTAAASTYSAGTIAPTVGQSVPPPSAKYLATDGNRLLMAGCYETSATSLQTATRTSRVWYTDVIGARDNTGEDESIVQTVDTKAWIDVGENDGDGIIGFAGPIYGVIFVFKERSVWRMTPTGISDAPYRVDRISDTIGALSQESIVVGATQAGIPAVYFQGATGRYRIVADATVIQNIGLDLSEAEAFRDQLGSTTCLLAWDAVNRIVWWVQRGGRNASSFQPDFEQPTAEGIRGGWSTHTIRISTSANVTTYAVAMYELSGIMRLHLGGGDAGVAAAIVTLTGTDYRDLASDTYPIAAVVVSRVYQPQGLDRRCRLGPPTIEYSASLSAMVHTVTVTCAIAGPASVPGPTFNVSGTTSATASVSAKAMQETLHNVQMSDIAGFTITVAWDLTAARLQRIYSVSVPVYPAEPA